MSLAKAFLIAALSAFALPARADESADKQRCASSHLDGQKQRKSGHLRAAQASFVVCGAERCPNVVRKDCVDWLAQVEVLVPRLVIEAHDATGTPTADVRVEMDGELLAERLTGIALSADPGQHRFRFTDARGQSRDEVLLLNEGERRKLVVDFAPTALSEPERPHPVQSSSRTIPAGVFVLGGIGVAAGAAGAILGLGALGDGRHLEDTCAPACDRSDARSVNNRALVADVLIGASILSFGAALYVLLARPTSAAAAQSISPSFWSSRGSVRMASSGK
jgi:hypothetical protein